jgi:hypothetical protein
VIFSTLGYMGEAVVFSYLGVSCVYYLLSQPVCWQFLVWELVILAVGRFIAIFLSYYAFSFFPGSPQNILTVNQIAFLVYAALIRGSIAFGLILKMNGDFQGHILPFNVKKEDFHTFFVFRQGEVEVIQSTTSALVIITTIVYGAFTNFA